MRDRTSWGTRCFPLEIKWSLDKCNTVCDSDNLRLFRVWLFTHCSCISIYQWTSIVAWPLDLHKLISSFSFQALHHGGCERFLMNCLVRRRLCLPISTHPSSLFLHHFLIYSHISVAFLLSFGIFPKLESRGGVNSSSLERYVICWDLHVPEEKVKNTKSISWYSHLILLIL